MTPEALMEAYNTLRTALERGIAKLVAHVNAVSKENLKGSFLAEQTKFDFQILSDKWARINRQELRNGEFVTTSVYCFVALRDHETKSLGKVKAGDVHKADNFKRAARHARATVLDEATFSACGPYGVAYLRR